jgi:hypothetical protein
MDPCARVRHTTKVVVEQASSVRIDADAVDAFAASLRMAEPSTWDADGWHYSADAAECGPLTAQYVFVLDALNFCFWPVDDVEYAELAIALRRVLEADPTAFDAAALAAMTRDTLAGWLAPHTLPLLDERVAKLREVGTGLLDRFDGSAWECVRRAKQSAVRLVSLIVESFPGFQDHSVYRGRQVCMCM